MQTVMKITGKYGTSTVKLRQKDADDSDYSYNNYLLRKLKSEQKKYNASVTITIIRGDLVLYQVNGTLH